MNCLWLTVYSYWLWHHVVLLVIARFSCINYVTASCWLPCHWHFYNSSLMPVLNLLLFRNIFSVTLTLFWWRHCVRILCLSQHNVAGGIMFSGCLWVRAWVCAWVWVYPCIPTVVITTCWRVLDKFSPNFQHQWWILEQGWSMKFWGQKVGFKVVVGPICWKMRFWPC